MAHHPPPWSGLGNRRDHECTQGVHHGTQQGAVSTRAVGRRVRAARRNGGKMPRGASLQ